MRGLADGRLSGPIPRTCSAARSSPAAAASALAASSAAAATRPSATASRACCSCSEASARRRPASSLSSAACPTHTQRDTMSNDTHTHPCTKQHEKRTSTYLLLERLEAAPQRHAARHRLVHLPLRRRGRRLSALLLPHSNE